MMQAKALLKSCPELTKSMLILGAKSSQIRTSSTSTADSTNTSNGNYLWTKSGAGLVNAKNAVQVATSGNYWYSNIRSLSDLSYSIGSFSSGQKIRIVMTFSRSSNGSISSTTDFDDIDIRLINSSGTTVASSVSAKNNVEIIEYKFTSSGSYKIKVTPYRVKDTSHGAFTAVSWMLI